nr:methyl-accepting chemotaxis protein [Kineosporia babensis]
MKLGRWRSGENRSWTVTASVFTSLAFVLALTLGMAVLALDGMGQVVKDKDRVIGHDTEMLLGARNLMDIRDARAAANRAYLFSGQNRYLGDQYRLDQEFTQQLDELAGRVDTARGRELVQQIDSLQSNFVRLDQSPIQLKQQGAPIKQVVAAWDEIDDQRITTNLAMNELSSYLQSLIEDREAAASDTARRGIQLVIGAFLAIVVGSTLVASLIVKQVRGRVFTVIRSVQSSSADLVRSAQRQAEGAGEQATSAAEISTTIKEMLTESRRIAQGAQDVVAAAGQTADAGRHGRDVVLATASSMDRIREHSGSLDTHMDDLTKKARQISGVVEIVAELSELTNIVAINASIEAAGAGSEAARFAALADEIRALADRVGGSAREISDLVASVSTAVEDTRRVSRDASEAIGDGASMAGQAVASFEEIVALVADTMESARQIQLSTSQQSMAVEQTDVAITAMADATREHQNSAGGTQATADELVSLSYQLGTLVQSSPPDGSGDVFAGSGRPGYARMSG